MESSIITPPILPPVYSMEFKILDSVLTAKDFDISQLEVVLDDIYDKAEDIDPELDIDISERDMYIMTNKIDEIEPIVSQVMKDSGLFVTNSLSLMQVYIDQELYNEMGVIEQEK
jgi:hypothetical protein